MAKWYLTKAGRREFGRKAEARDEMDRLFELRKADAWTWWDDNPRDKVEAEAFEILFWSCSNARDVIQMINEQNYIALERGVSISGINAEVWQGLKTIERTTSAEFDRMESAYRAETARVIAEAERVIEAAGIEAVPV